MTRIDAISIHRPAEATQFLKKRTFDSELKRFESRGAAALERKMIGLEASLLMMITLTIID